MEQYGDVHMELGRIFDEYIRLGSEIRELQKKKFVLNQKLIKMLAEHMPEALQVNTNKLLGIFGMPNTKDRQL